MSERRELARLFEEARPRLSATASRLLGSPAEAEDAVQEAWLRLARTDPSDIDSLDAWLSTVVSRICLDMLGSSRWRRERAWQVAPWPVDPVSTAPDPLDLAERGEAVTQALLAVLDTLTPAERVAFVLHDIFGRSFDEVGAALGRSPVASRQLASRGRRRLREQASDAPRRRSRERRIVNAWLKATEEGDLSTLLSLLAEDAVLVADYGSTTAELQGRDEIAGQARLAGRLASGSVPARIGGRPGVVARVSGRVVSIMAFTMEDEVITRLHVLADPARLSKLHIASTARE